MDLRHRHDTRMQTFQFNRNNETPVVCATFKILKINGRDVFEISTIYINAV